MAAEGIPTSFGSPLGYGGPQLPFIEYLGEYVEEIKLKALENGDPLQDPILLMGIAERVGSNWLLDSLGRRVHTYNEPFRQQLHRSHSLSTMNPEAVRIDDFDPSNMQPYETYWLTTFVASKYSQEVQAVKETNLFFANDTFVRLFPNSKILLLTRDPLGIVSSFQQGDLYDRWDYDERYEQLLETSRNNGFERHHPLLRDGESRSKLGRLSRLIVLNGLLLCEATEGGDSLIVRYEDSVLRRQEVASSVNAFANSQALLEVEEYVADDQNALNIVDGTFSTRKRLISPLSNLDSDEVREVRAAVDNALAQAAEFVPEHVFVKTLELLTASNEYTTSPAKGSLPYRKPSVIKTAEQMPEVAFVEDTDKQLKWRNTLVTNTEFCNFLNDMLRQGRPNLVNGTQLFFNENMLLERGGRLFFDQDKSAYEVAAGYKYHPVYWVTWLGAAAFALSEGCRLPTRDQISGYVERQDVELGSINSDYKIGDTEPVNLRPPDRNGIYDAVGNLAIWCEDGPRLSIGTLSRYIYGVAWNKEGNVEGLAKTRVRPIASSSRGVGIRLVGNRASQASFEQIAKVFDDWFKLLATKVELPEADDYIIDALTI